MNGTASECARAAIRGAHEIMRERDALRIQLRDLEAETAELSEQLATAETRCTNIALCVTSEADDNETVHTHLDAVWLWY